jgi:predicted nucleic acid-binding protein
MAPVIVDAGPIYAFLDRDEKHHNWTCTRFRQIRGPVLTCDAALSEVCYLLQRGGGKTDGLREILRRKVVMSGFTSTHSLDRAFELMAAYQDVPMSLADACLVVMIEQNPGSVLFTLDRDFSIYRQHRRRLIPLIAPFSS